MKRVLVFISVIIFLLPICSLAATINVPGDQPTIQAGIDAAVEGDVVLLSDGTYTGEGNYELSASKNITISSANGSEVTIVDCLWQGRFGIFSNGVTISRLKIINAWSGDGNSGGAIYSSGNISVENCLFEDNRASVSGGAIYSVGSLSVTDCDFTGNIAQNGGAIYHRSGALNLVACLFTNNSVEGSAFFLGPVNESQILISDCIFEGNISPSSGGAIKIESDEYDNDIYNFDGCRFSSNDVAVWATHDGSLSFKNCIFSHNQRGALLLDLKECTIEQCVFDTNSGEFTIRGTRIRLSVTKTLFQHNSISGRGGAIKQNNGLTDLTNCIFWDNSSEDYGGAVYLGSSSGNISITNCTFDDNFASLGGHVVAYDTSSNFCATSTFVLRNNIFWNNAENDEIKKLGTCSAIMETNCSSDPLYVNAQDGDFHIRGLSPCIDTGTPYGSPLEDFDGNPRPVGNGFDIGAYESVPAFVRGAIDFNADNIHDISLFSPDNRKWYIKDQSEPTYGTNDCLPIPGDYTGDGATDLAIVDLTRLDGLAKWYLDGAGVFIYGLQEWIPVPGDYDGNGTTDAALFDPDTGKWYVRGQFVTTYGSGGIPVPGDYNGDGITDIAVFYPANNKWYIKDIGIYTYGMADCIPAPADYDGDGSTDLAVIDTSRPDGMAKWYIRNQAVFIYGAVDNTIPVPGDYDGDGDSDPCLFYQDSGKWYCRNVGIWSYGNNSMIPLASNLSIRYAISQAEGGSAVW